VQKHKLNLYCTYQNANASQRWHFYFPAFDPYILKEMELKDSFKIGYVLKPHGLKGGVTVALDADIPTDFAELETVFLQDGHQLVPYFIETVSVTGNKAFVKFEEVDTPEAAGAISKRAVYLPKSERPKSGRGEFYDDEINGFVVEDETLGELGTITDVMSAGANRLLVMDYDGREVLIPINSPFIKSINKSKKRISVNLPEGFLDI
jgi:16S rRNA processing protein RimM